MNQTDRSEARLSIINTQILLDRVPATAEHVQRSWPVSLPVCGAELVALCGSGAQLAVMPDEDP